MSPYSGRIIRGEFRGFAMIAVLGFVVAISILSTVFFKSVHRSVLTQQLHIMESRTYTLAESGVHHAAARLVSNGTYAGDQNILFGEGSFSTIVNRSDNSDAWVVESTGTIGEARQHTFTVRATIAKTERGWETLAWKRVPKKVMLEGGVE